jgi:gliding motility-associated-like protein
MIRQQLLGNSGCITTDSLLIHVHPAIDTHTSVKMYCLGVNTAGQPYFQWQRTPSTALYFINKDGKQITATKDTFFTDIQAENTTSAYTVIAEDSCGNKTKQISYILPQLSGENYNNEYAQLSWPMLQNMDAVQYCIEKQDKSGNFVSLACPPVNTNEYRDNNFLQTGGFDACYRLSVLLSNGCNAVSAPLCLEYQPRIYIPNAFTPNRNEQNDSFLIRTVGVKQYHISIYNRWGERIFESNDPHQPWTGEDCPSDVYYYIIEANTGEGKVFRKGNITLMR